MNKYTKMFALVGAALLLGACQEDFMVPEAVVVPGEEIQFGASACFESGNEETRTIYGDVVVDSETGAGLIEVEWVPGTDRIDIACPQAVGSKNSEYTVKENKEETNGTTANNFSSSTLTRISPVGLQWSTSDTHNFYAVYPSINQVKEKLAGRLDETALNNIKFDENKGELYGYLPIDQSPAKSSLPDQTKEGLTKGGKPGWSIEPDMTFAYMLANKTHTKGQGADIGLSFSSQVTALQFEIVCNELVSGNTTATDAEINIAQITLYSGKSQNICGNFKYSFATDAFECTNTTTGFTQVRATFANGIKLKSGQALDYTFFLLPGTDFNATDANLRLTILYTIDGTPHIKTATIQKDITAKKKYYFKNVKLPKIDISVEGSSWFSGLNPAIYLSQISMPAAGNAFSSEYSSTGTNALYIREQVKTYTDLWNMGVRGFEIVTSVGGNSSDDDLANERVVCNGGEVASAPTVDEIFAQFATFFESYANECLVLIFRYQPYTGDGSAPDPTWGNWDPSDVFSPQMYLDQLTKYLSTQKHFGQDKFVMITPTSRVGDLKGKVAVLVRPGDSPISNTDDLDINNGMANKITVIGDWGTCVDQWDRRYGSTYHREGAVSTTDATDKIENYLWAVADDEAGETFIQNFVVEGYPEFNFDNTNFLHTVNGEASAAYVQDFIRIIPNGYAHKTSGININNAFYSGLSDSYWGNRDYLYLKWPESIEEKKTCISETLKKSIATKSSVPTQIYINSLSSYYATPSHNTSFYPYNTSYSYDHRTYVLSGAGAGGDWAGCAADLNTYFYDQIKELNEATSGPFGLVIMNYIGATADDFNASDYANDIDAESAKTASAQLPYLIMMNNFKFPLATDPNYVETIDDTEDITPGLTEEETDAE